MNRTESKFLNRLRDERGVALPLALLGLIAVTLMVTGILLTSSTEVAISGAHQDATSAPYVAEGGLQSYVAEQGIYLASAAGTGAISYTPAGATSDQTVDITVTRLSERVIPTTGGEKERIYSIVAEPTSNGSRSVGLFARHRIPPPIPFNTNIESAVTIGGDLDVNGNAFTVTGRSTTCGSGGVQAVVGSQDSDIHANTETHLDNFVGTDSLGNQTVGRDAIETRDLTREELAAHTLGLTEGQTLDDLIDRIPADHKWGPRFSPDPENIRTFDGTVSPEDLVAVIDADGGTVDLNGVSGLVIIVNGDLSMSGSAAFAGIIIVEGNFRLQGTPTVSGALISLAMEGTNEIDLDTSAISSGHITVQFDQCAVNVAQDAFDATAVEATPIVLPTFAWFEVVR